MTLLPPPGSAPPFDVGRAAAAGLLDVVYTEIDTPVGRVVAARTPRGLARLAYEDTDGGLEAVLEALAARLSPRVLEAPARLDDVRRQLDEYFSGARHSFELPVDLALVRGPFARRLLEATARTLSSTAPTATGRRARARWTSSALRCAMVSAQARRLDPARSRG